MPFSKKIIALLTLCGLSLAVSAQKRLPGDKPKVIVQIVVGQMRADYLLRFKENLTEEGFRTFTDEGAFCHNARYQFMLTQTTPGLATIATGTNPSQHGIPSDTWFDRVNNRIHKACHDSRHYPVGSNDDNLSKSPKDLVASTFGDELKLLNSNSKIFGVSFDPEPAILLSGHNSDGAYWFDALSGKFVTSSYYAENLPSWVVEFNNKNFANIYLGNNWETLFPVNQYVLANGVRAKSNGTPHVLAKGKKVNGKRKVDYATLRETPYGDNITKDFAISLIVEEGLGRDENTDLLSIYFGGLRDIGDKYGTMSLELEDAFYRMDENMKHLLTFINQQIGKENVLIVFTSDHGANLSQDFLEKNKMKSGTFDHNKALVLLRSYLNIVYGKGDWVKTFHQKQIYLNRNLIEDANQRLGIVQGKVAEFLIQFSGVTNAITSYTLDNNNFSNGIIESIQNGYYPKRSGDIIINLEPGWVETSSPSNSNSPYNYDAHVPLAFYGWKTKRKIITTPVDMTDIAPTLSTLVGIPMPNAACGKPIPEMVE